ncbi:DNA-binding transcriptional regulator, AcrR family [Streptomyces indicus]|uniref:DNA-binding transcriptional regulator, AcrR family n=2 Tax=Streptomyces indicus TaxID=417292 RepID=A0A1G8YFS5_9ACTN|nr:DNA-binding transcriptional regulator, AcrR family [Streptomyces indicus]
MARLGRGLSRLQLQAQNRAKVLAAARAEFAARGFEGAKVDAIAERAGLTRGAVYSNFSGKRALYFSVLADLAEGAPAPRRPEPPATPAAALGAYARILLTGLPLTSEHGRLGSRLQQEILAEEATRSAYAQLLKLDAVVLGLCLEEVHRRGASAAAPRRVRSREPGSAPRVVRSPDPGAAPRMVRAAEAALTFLYGARQLADSAPGFVDPFHAVAACERLAAVADDGSWPPAYLPYAAEAVPCDRPWEPPPATDVLRARPARLGGADGVVAVLGLQRLEAVEELVRSAEPGAQVTAVLVSADPHELTPLARLTLAELRTCVSGVFPPETWPALRIVYDGTHAVAGAVGLDAVDDGTEAAVRIEAGRITAFAGGRGACHAAASSSATGPSAATAEPSPAATKPSPAVTRTSPAATRTSPPPVPAERPVPH